MPTMTLRCCIALTVFSLIFCSAARGQQSREGASIADVYTDKARYAPHESVTIFVQLKNDPSLAGKAVLKLTFWHLGERVGEEISRTVDLPRQEQDPISIDWAPPDRDFRGYLVDVRLVSPSGEKLGTGYTAVDVSSQWNRFPRYGYLAHYSKAEGAMPAEWIAELNKFHINSLEYYDFENRHDQPLAGIVEHPDSEWKDIAGRKVERSIVDGFLAEAHRYNMMSMAYNTSYCAYADAFANGSGVKLQWATWPKPDGPRTLETAMALNLDGGDEWKTHRLVYMNQNLPVWQNYLFGKMENLFRVYPFDGWQVDTFGTRGAYSYQGSYVSFIQGFRPFVDNAHAFLKKDIVLNTVNTWGQDDMARSAAAFVHSELWEDHETYSSIVDAAEQVHTTNPAKAVVFAAYLQRKEGGKAEPKTNYFNPSSVLLADATIFASGAAHIELGDGSRMLSSEYFPADTRFAVSPDLSSQLRHYYDFLTAYENVLSYKVAVAPAAVSVAGQPSSAAGVPNTIWTLARQRDGQTIIHLINLLGSSDAHWRDVHADRPEAPLLEQVRVRIAADEDITRAGWASPDVDGGMFHPLAMTQGNDKGQRYVELVLPSLKYWDMIVLDGSDRAIP
jgi:dextranase